MKCLLSVAAVAVVLQTASLVRAAEEESEPTPAQVRTAAEAFDRGREAYKSEDYVEAAEQFESADANAPSAAALELAIRARDKAGQLDRAATLAALALVRHPNEASIQKVAPGIVQKAKSQLFELDVKCNDPCDVTVAGRLAPGRRATDRTIFLSPGTYSVRAGWSGERSKSKQVEATGGESSELAFEAPAEVSAPATPTKAVNAPLAPQSGDEGVRQKALPPEVFWIGVGVTAVLGGITLWSGLDTQNNPGANKVKDECQAQKTDCMTLYQQGVDKQHRTNILIGTTATLGIATTVIGVLFTNWAGKKTSEPIRDAAYAAKLNRGLRIEPWIAIGGGASVGAFGRF